MHSSFGREAILKYRRRKYRMQRFSSSYCSELPFPSEQRFPLACFTLLRTLRTLGVLYNAAAEGSPVSESQCIGPE